MNRRLHLLTLCVLLIFILNGCQTDEIEPPQWQWERAEAGLPRQAITVAVAVDPLDPTHLWAGYYAAGGLATSHDGGQTWLAGAEGLADNPVFDLLPVADTLAGQSKVAVWAATRDGLLWLSENYYPAWRATDETGRSLPIYRADYTFRAVPVSAGTHRITFEYHSAIFANSVWLSLVCLVILLGGTVAALRRPRPATVFEPTPPPTTEA